jgi:tRNA-dihydrouridine synthase
MTSSTKLLGLLDIEAPIIQAPMAGVSTPKWRLRFRTRARSGRSASVLRTRRARSE